MQVRIGFSPNDDGSIKRKPGINKKPRQWDGMYLDTDPTYVDKWYNQTKDFTFETEIIQLTLDEMKAIKFMCQHYHIYKNAPSLTENEKIEKGVIANYDLHKLSIDNSYQFGEHFNWKKIDSPQYLNPMLGLEKKINDIMIKMNCDDGIFIRLNTHSPKDAAMNSINTYKLFYKELKIWDKINRFNDINDNKDANDNDNGNHLVLKDVQICQAYYRSATRSLGYRNGFEALDTFCRSHDKIFHDILLSTLKQDESLVKLFLILRKWEKDLDPLWEFRLIIQNNIPTGLCQYHSTCMIPMINKYNKYIENGILNKFKIIQPNLSKALVNYTMDFAVILKNKKKQNIPYDENYYKHINDIDDDDDDDKYDDNDASNPIDKIIMIEINHEPPIAGTPLFDVKNNDNDKKILKEGPFEFRYITNDNQVEARHLDRSFPHIIDYVKVLKGELIPKPKAVIKKVINDNVNNNNKQNIVNGKADKKSFWESCQIL